MEKRNSKSAEGSRVTTFLEQETATHFTVTFTQTGLSEAFLRAWMATRTRFFSSARTIATGVFPRNPGHITEIEPFMGVISAS